MSSNSSNNTGGLWYFKALTICIICLFIFTPTSSLKAQFLNSSKTQPNKNACNPSCGTAQNYTQEQLLNAKDSPFSPNMVPGNHVNNSTYNKNNPSTLKNGSAWNINNGYGDNCTVDCNIDPYDNGPSINSNCNPGTFANIPVYRVPVVFTIVPACDGTAPDDVTIDDITTNLAVINEYLQSCQNMPIELYKATNYSGAPTTGDFSTQIITDTTLCSFTNNTANQMYAEANFKIPNVLNIFIADTVNGYNTCNGFSSYPINPGSDMGFVTIESSCFVFTAVQANGNGYSPCPAPGWGQVIIHELGHFFGLYHTHNQNSINGTNTSALPSDDPCTTGDFIEDTCADPNINTFGTDDPGDSDFCMDAWSGTSDDAAYNGQPSAYSCTQAFNNIMSYNFGVGCTEDFTPCQKAKMVDALVCAYYNLCSPNPDFYLNNPNTQYRSYCVGDNIPNINGVQGRCYNWYDSPVSSTPLSSGQVLNLNSLIDNSIPGVYTFYVEDYNSFQSPPCRLPIEITVFADPGDGVSSQASQVNDVEVCASTSITVSAENGLIGPEQLTGWWLSTNQTATANINNQAQLDAAIAANTGDIFKSTFSTPVGSPLNSETFSIDCDAVPNGTSYYVTPFVADGLTEKNCINTYVGESIIVPSGGNDFGSARLEIDPIICTADGRSGPPSFTLELDFIQNMNGYLAIWENGCPSPLTFPADYTQSSVVGNITVTLTENDFTPNYDITNAGLCIYIIGSVGEIINFNATLTTTYQGVDAVDIWDNNGQPSMTYSDCVFGEPIEIVCNCGLGCTDPQATNYNPNATQDDGSCDYLLGCTDPLATNYDPNAQLDDGSCDYLMGCTDPQATNYDPNAQLDDGSCNYPSGCTDPLALNYDPNAQQDDGSCNYLTGCTDSQATNYDPNAQQDDGSCNYAVVENNCTIDTLTVNTVPITSNNYDAIEKVCSSGSVPNGAQVSFVAGECVEVNPGFEVIQGADFLIQMIPCQLKPFIDFVPKKSDKINELNKLGSNNY